MSSFAKAIMVFFDIHAQSSDLLVHDSSTLWAQPDKYTDATLTTYSSSGWDGTHSVLVPNALRCPLFGEEPVSIHLRSETVAGFVLRKALVTLTQNQLLMLSTNRRERHNKDDVVGEFAFNLLPFAGSERVFPTADERRYGSLLEVTIAPGNHGDAADSARSARLSLGVDQTVVVPVEIDGIIVLPGPLRGGVNDSMTTLSRNVCDSSNELELSAIAVRLIELMSAIHCVKYMTASLQSLPIADASPATYVARRLPGNVATLSMYETHLGDREELLTAILMADDKVNTFESLVAKGRLARYARERRVASFPEIVAEQYPVGYQYDPLSKLFGDLDESFAEYRQVKRSAEARDRLIAEYLRDRVNAAVADSNLSIQRMVIRLTIIAVVLAILAILEGVLPDTLRSQLFSWVVEHAKMVTGVVWRVVVRAAGAVFGES
jgi:hypothetical protein